MALHLGTDTAGTSQFSLQDFEPSWGSKMNAAVSEAWLESYGPVATDYARSLMADDASPKLSGADAGEIIKASGLKVPKLSLADGKYTKSQLDVLLERQREMTAVRDVRERTPWDAGSAVRGVAMFGAGIADPLNLATAFVPWTKAITALNGVRAAAMAESFATRTAARAALGGADAGISTAVLEPAYFEVRQQLGDDYGALDAMANIAFGTAFGAGIHSGGGAAADLVRYVRTGRYTPSSPALPANPAPPADFAPPAGTVAGGQTRIRVGDTYEPAQWSVIDSDDLQATVDKSDNQFRDRSRAAYQAEIQQRANNLDFNLLAESPVMDYGAPTLAADGRIVGGNGRALFVARAYDIGKGGDYRAALEAKLGELGIDAESVRGMKRPVLVRVLQRDVDVRRAAMLSNEGGSTDMSPLEQAKVDAERLGDTRLAVSADGGLDAPENRAGIRKWVDAQPENKRNSLVDDDGRLSSTGMQRLNAALMFKAYGDSPVLGRLIESMDPGSRNIAQAIGRTSPVIANARALIGTGDLHPLDIAADLQMAVEKYNQLRDQGAKVADYFAQLDAFGDGLTPEARLLLDFMGRNAGSPRRMADGITGFYDALGEAGNPKQADMFGAASVPDKLAMLQDAITRAETGLDAAADVVAGLAPETREAALRAAVAQSVDGRDVDVVAIMGMDESLGTSTIEDVKAAADRNMAPEQQPLADFGAAEAVQQRVDTSPKWDGLADAEAAAAEADTVLSDVVAAGDQAYKYSRGEGPGQKKATLWQGTTARFTPEDGAPHGRFRWDYINSDHGEGAQAFGYGHYLAQQSWISQKTYRERLVDHKSGAGSYTIPDGVGGVLELTRGDDPAWQMPDGTIVHFGQKSPELRAVASAIAQVNLEGYAGARSTLENILAFDRESAAEQVASAQKLIDDWLSDGVPADDPGVVSATNRIADIQGRVSEVEASLAALDVVTEHASGVRAERDPDGYDGDWKIFNEAGEWVNSVHAQTEAAALRIATGGVLADGIQKYVPPAPANLRERLVTDGGEELDIPDLVRGWLKFEAKRDGLTHLRELTETHGLSLVERQQTQSGTNAVFNIGALVNRLISDGAGGTILDSLVALQERGVSSVTLEMPGSLYRAEMDISAFDRLMLWDAPMSEQPQVVRDAFKRWGIVDPPKPEIPSLDALLSHYGYKIDKAPDGSPAAYRLTFNDGSSVYYPTLGDAEFSVLREWRIDNGIDDIQPINGESAYRRLKSRIASGYFEEKGTPEQLADMDAAMAEISRRRGMDEDDFDVTTYRDNGLAAVDVFLEDEIASVMLHNAGVPGHAFLDGQSRGSGDGTYNVVVYSDDVAQVVDRYARQTGEIGRAIDDPAQLTEALRQSFGGSTDALVTAGRIQIVATPADIPGGPHPGDVKGATAPDGTVYMVASNVSEAEARGMVLHEVGVHVGMEQMLGADVFGQVLAQLDDAIMRGEDWAQAARAAVPADTPAGLVREEQLAYLVQNAPTLPIVKRIVAAVRAWAYQHFGLARDRMTLSEADFRALAVSALHAVARQDARAVDLSPAYSREAAPYDPENFPESFDFVSVYRTEGAHEAYKGKALFGRGRYFGLDESMVGEMQLNPHRETVDEWSPDRGGVDAYVLPPSLKLKTIDLTGEVPAVLGDALRASVLADGFDGIAIKTDGDLNYGGDQVVLFNDDVRLVRVPRDGDAGGGMRYSRGETQEPAKPADELKPYNDRIARAKQYAPVLRAAADKLENDAGATEAMRAALPDLTAEEITDLLDQLRKQVKGLRVVARSARDGLQAADVANDLQPEAMKAADELANNIEMAAVIEKRNAQLNMAARLRASSFLEQFRESKLDFEGFRGLLVGTERRRIGGRLSIDAEQKQLRGEWLGGMIADLEKEGLMPQFASGTFDRDVYVAMYDLGKGRSVASLPDEAVAIARVINKYQEDARNTRNRFGAWIRDMSGYIVRQSHDMFKIRDAGEHAFKQFVLPRLDLERSMRDFDGDANDFLTRVYDDFAAGSHMKTPAAEDDMQAFGRGASLAKRESQSRVLYFKDGAAAFEYNQKFGHGRLAESVLQGLDHASKSAGLLKVAGTNPEAMLTRLFDEYAESLRGDPQRRAAFLSHRKEMQNLLSHVDGSVNIPGSFTGARISSFLRSWQTMAKLGGMLISSVTDLTNYAAELRFGQNKNLFSGLIDSMGAITRGRADGERQAILNSLGVFHESTLGAVFNRFDNPDLVGGKTAALMQQYFKLTGINWWTESLRDGYVLSHSNYLASNAAQAWDALPASLRDMLGLYNIDGGKWDVLRIAAMTEADGRRYMTPDGLQTVPYAALENYIQTVGRTPSEAAVQNLRDDLAGALRAMAIDRMHHAVIEPNARVRAFMQRGTQPGTVSGEFLRFIGQFKSFPVAMIQMALGREVYGRGYDTIGDYIKRGKGEMLGLATFIGVSTMMGYGAMSIKDLLRGKEPRPIGDPATWAAAFVQGGGMGIYGDFLFGKFNRMGGTLTGSLVGPVGNLADTVADLWTRIRSGDDLAATAFNAALQNTPFGNLFYTRTALDYLILYKIQEALNPGFLRRAEKRAERENGQTFFLPPSQVVR